MNFGGNRLKVLILKNLIRHKCHIFLLKIGKFKKILILYAL